MAQLQMIKIEKRNGLYDVIYRDKTGMSILARTPNLVVAKNKKQKFQDQINAGQLLKEEKSVWKNWKGLKRVI